MIKSEKEYQEALNQLWDIFDGDNEDEIQRISKMIEDYEDIHYMRGKHER